jgi:hypothetical protein
VWGTHADCASGKLDQLILRKVRQELASLDADPVQIPGCGQTRKSGWMTRVGSPTIGDADGF